ncbi:MAG: hypothetical protein Q7U68_03055, partial [Candidatus Roizmanbacteria bacterium]|nr:hypothetical protein [Candidatus Roizmanbacteria bacterium]
FEYGMNCVVDRMFETQGRELAQRAYEELKKSGCCVLRRTRDSSDIRGVPVLFGVHHYLTEGVPAINRAARDLAAEQKQTARQAAIRYDVFTDEPILPLRLPGESDVHYALKLGILSVALKTRSGDRGIESSEVLSLYGDLVIEALPETDCELEERDIMWSLWAGRLLAQTIPASVAHLQTFLKHLTGSFWQVQWTAFLDYVVRYTRMPDLLAKIDVVADTVEDGTPNEYQSLNEDGIWNYIYRRFTQAGYAGDAAALIASAIILKRRPHRQTLRNAVQGADSDVLCCYLLRKCYDQAVNKV